MPTKTTKKEKKDFETNVNVDMDDSEEREIVLKEKTAEYIG